MRRHDCSQITDGAAVVFLASEERAAAHAKKVGRPLESFAKIKGWGHTTAPMLMATKLEDSREADYLLPWTRKAITDAYRRAGIQGAEDLDAIETHDCFTVNEYVAIEHFGITAEAAADKARKLGGKKTT